MGLAGLALLLVGWLEPALRAGGLAPLLVGAVLALGLVTPVVRGVQRSDEPLPDGLDALLHGGAIVTAGAALAHAFLPLGVPGALLASLPWLALRLGQGRSTSPSVPGRPQMAFAAVAGPILGLAWASAWWLAGTPEGTTSAGPWALLSPRWTAVGTWWPHALVVGLLLPALGLGLWRQPALRAVGPDRRALSLTGLALVLLALHALALGGLHGLVPPDGAAPRTPRLALAALAALGLAPALTGLARARMGARAATTAGLLWTLWFLATGAAAAEVWLLAAVPAIIALLAGWTALSHGGELRLGAGLTAVLAAAAALAGWPGLPDDAWAAAAVAGTAVGLLWWLGLDVPRREPA